MVANTAKMHKVKQLLYGIMYEEAYITELFNGLVNDGDMDRQKLEEFRKISKMPNLHEDEIVNLTREEIMNNPYLRDIEFPNVTLNNFRLAKKRIIRPGVITVNGGTTRNLTTMRKVNSYFICNKALRFPALVEGDSNTCWMSVEPYEINTFKEIIEEATGDVLLLGCGLGYAAYMISLKDNVRSVTIVDSSQDVLDMFTTFILPQFKNKDKITTVKSDALGYLKSCDLTSFNYVNVDIWYDTIDMIYTYLRCLEIEKANPSVKFSYWLEEDLKSDIQKSILCAISDYSDPTRGFLSDRIAQDLVKDTDITCYEDVYHLVNIENLRDLLYKWYCDNYDVVRQYEDSDIRRMNIIHSNSSLTRCLVQTK